MTRWALVWTFVGGLVWVGCYERTAALCGDGTRAPDEDCDREDLGGATCGDLGYYGGELRCDDACGLDTSGCVGRCGDGRIQIAHEQCDGTALEGETCESVGYYGGELACDVQCRLDVSGCGVKGRCGDGVVQVDDGEQCDGSDLGGTRCDLSWASYGTLGCRDDCQLDSRECAAELALVARRDVEIHALAVGAAGRVLVGGNVDGSLEGVPNQGREDAFLAAVDGSGDVLWSRQWGSEALDQVYAIAMDARGDIYVACDYETELEPLDGRAQLVKLTGDGSPLWTLDLDGPAYVGAADVAVVPGGDVVICGVTFGSLHGQHHAGDADLYAARFTGDGSWLWTRQWGSPSFDVVESCAVDRQGALYLTGTTFGDLNGEGPAQETDAFLMKVTGDGSHLWTRLLGTENYDQGMGLAVDGTDGVYVSGLTFGDFEGGAPGAADLFLARFTPEGAMQWVHQLGSGNNDWNVGLHRAADGHLYLTGHSNGSFGPGSPVAGLCFDVWGDPSTCDDALLLKLDPEGQVVWSRSWGTAGADGARTVVSDTQGRLYVAGYADRTEEPFAEERPPMAFVIQTIADP